LRLGYTRSGNAERQERCAATGLDDGDRDESEERRGLGGSRRSLGAGRRGVQAGEEGFGGLARPLPERRTSRGTEGDGDREGPRGPLLAVVLGIRAVRGPWKMMMARRDATIMKRKMDMAIH